MTPMRAVTAALSALLALHSWSVQADAVETCEANFTFVDQTGVVGSYAAAVREDLVRLRLRRDAAQDEGDTGLARNLHQRFLSAYRTAKGKGIDLGQLTTMLDQARSSHTKSEKEKRRLESEKARLVERLRRPWKSVMEFRGYNFNGSTVEFSPTESRFIQHDSGSTEAWIRDIQTGKTVVTLKGPTQRVRNNGGLAFSEPDDISTFGKFKYSPDGSMLLSLDPSKKGGLVWNTATGEKIAEIIPHLTMSKWHSFSNDSRLVAISSLDGSLRLSEARTGRTIDLIIAHNEVINHHAFSPDDAFIATASNDKTAKIWNAKTGAEVMTLKHGSPVYSVEFSPDGKLLMTKSGGGWFEVWDLQTKTSILKIASLETGPGHAQFSSDSTRIAITNKDENSAMIVDVWSGVMLHVLPDHSFAPGHTFFSSDGQMILTSSTDAAVRFWLADDGTPLGGINTTERVRRLSMSADGKYVMTKDWQGKVQIWTQSEH